ncbi:MAG: hypothetical protein RIQ53_1741 [Pseudomonadota bacterium]|jgi:outer membrane protein assembly factor BamD
MNQPDRQSLHVTATPAAPAPRASRHRAGWAGVLLALTLAGCASMPDPANDPTLSAEKLYADAREDLTAGAYDKAVKTLERVEGRGAGTLLAQQALLDMAWAQWKLGERASALASVDRFIKLHPSSPAMDYALYLKGLINFADNLGLLSGLSRQNLAERDQQAARDAHQAFAQLIEQHPQSRYADDARYRMDYIVNLLAEHEVLVARYYYRRGAYLAAANRAQSALREFQRAPALEEALYILAASYDKLGLETLARDAERVLLRNFPDTRHMRDGVRLPEKAWWQFW